MATYKLAVIIRNSTNSDEFLIIKQTPPPKYDDQEYDSYADSDLWDLPSVKLTSLSPEVDSSTQFVLQGEEACSHKLSLRKFDLPSALGEEFSVRKFESTCTIHFFSRWMWTYVQNRIDSRTLMLLGGVTAFGIALLYTSRNNLNS